MAQCQSAALSGTRLTPLRGSERRTEPSPRLLAGASGHRYSRAPVSAAVSHITSWVQLAACRGLDVSLWFAPVGSLDERAALAVCAACPVRAACLVDALETEAEARGDYDVAGVRGGLRASERRALRSS